MEDEQRSILLRRAMHDGKAFDFQNYHTLSEVFNIIFNSLVDFLLIIHLYYFEYFINAQINTFLADLASTSPLVSTSVIGKTYESKFYKIKNLCLRNIKLIVHRSRYPCCSRWKWRCQ